MFVRHPVKDFKTWKKAYDKFDPERAPMGVIADAVFQASDNPNDVTAWHDFKTLAEAKAFATSARLKEVMKDAGVEGPPTVWFASEAD
jgi:hypothetical protein